MLTTIVEEPLRESAHRLLIQTHLGEGNRQEVVRHFWLCRDLMGQRA